MRRCLRRALSISMASTMQMQQPRSKLFSAASGRNGGRKSGGRRAKVTPRVLRLKRCCLSSTSQILLHLEPPRREDWWKLRQKYRQGSGGDGLGDGSSDTDRL